jgi:phage portal protein BeeE
MRLVLRGADEAPAERVEPAAPVERVEPAAGNGSGPPPTPATGFPGLPPWPPPLGGYGGYLPENLSVVCACISAIAGTIGSLPVGIFQRIGDKRVERPDHPLARLVRAPNSLQSWPDFIEWLLASTLLRGNGIAVIDHDGAGRPTALYPVPWHACQPLLVPAAQAEAIGSPLVPNAKLVFDVVQTFSPWPWPGPQRATGFPIRFFSDEVLFLRDRSDDGILGRSRLSRCPEVLAAALGAQNFSANCWVNGAMLGGVVQHPGRLSKEASDRIAQSWRSAYSGPANAARVAILEEGMSFTKVSTTLEDAELLDSRRFSVEELARVFDVPPPIIGDWSKATFSNTASAREWFAALTLLPWVNKIEQEFRRTVINDPDISLCIDMSGMLRGDFPQLVNSYVQLTRAGIASADEARHAVGLDPRGGEADRLMATAIGGRPGMTSDGEGATPPAVNGSGRGANGAANGLAAS